MIRRFRNIRCGNYSWIAVVLLTGLFARDYQAVAENLPYDAELVKRLVTESLEKGNPGRGAVIYSAPTSACLSCHKVGEHGGAVGPDLSDVGKKQKLNPLENEKGLNIDVQCIHDC